MLSTRYTHADRISIAHEYAYAVLHPACPSPQESGAEIPPEAVRLLKKAMKQRRGSVDNVAETLMASLAASGESNENIAKAMVKALKATGTDGRTDAKLMQNGGTFVYVP